MVSVSVARAVTSTSSCWPFGSPSSSFHVPTLVPAAGNSAPVAAESSSEVSPALRNVPAPPRSEEHTSELQSRQYLVCRLLLEKKKKTYKIDFCRRYKRNRYGRDI